MGKREIELVYIIDEDVMGHIESDHGSWARIIYTKNQIRYTVNMTSDEFIITEVIEVEDDE